MFVPIRRGFVRKRTDPVAKLLRVERREVHGQMVDVEIWGPGCSGRDEHLPVQQIVDLHRAAAAEEKKYYQPRQELAYMGLPASPVATNSGERSKKGKDDR